MDKLIGCIIEFRFNRTSLYDITSINIRPLSTYYEGCNYTALVVAADL